jgi:hypothetical protein
MSPVPDGWTKDISFDINISNNEWDEDPDNFTAEMLLPQNETSF